MNKDKIIAVTEALMDDYGLSYHDAGEIVMDSLADYSPEELDAYSPAAIAALMIGY